MPVISRGVPAFASSGNSAGYADDADYTSHWRSSGPAWLAYDLSSVPAAQRGLVMLAWYNDPITTPYNHTLVGDVAYDNLSAYTVQVNSAAGGGSPPSSGWVTVATVSGNTYHSRQHFFNMAGNKWVRLNITAIDGSAGNMDAMVNMDVHDASAGASDAWTFYGDSITEDGMPHQPVSGSGQNYSQLVNASMPDHFPSFEDGGTGGLVSADGSGDINTWLPLFPGHYVGLSFGTNDANGCMSPTSFYNNYVLMVQAVLTAGKVPVVPTIPWARTANVQNCGPGLNAKIAQLYTAYPGIVHGPDLWAFFSTHQSLISSDNLHPSDAGYVAYRQQWANAMLSNV